MGDAWAGFWGMGVGSVCEWGFGHGFGVEGMGAAGVQLFVSGTPGGVEGVGMAGVQLGFLVWVSTPYGVEGMGEFFIGYRMVLLMVIGIWAGGCFVFPLVGCIFVESDKIEDI